MDSMYQLLEIFQDLSTLQFLKMFGNVLCVIDNVHNIRLPSDGFSLQMVSALYFVTEGLVDCFLPLGPVLSDFNCGPKLVA